MKRGKDDRQDDVIIVEVRVIASMTKDEYICRLLFGAEGGVGASSDDANDVSSTLVLRDTPQTHCDCKAGNDLCAHVGAALMILRAVQTLPMECWDDFHGTCPESVKSYQDYPIPTDFAYTKQDSVLQIAKHARNKTFDDGEAKDEAKDEADGHTDKSKDVERRVLSTFKQRLEEVQRLRKEEEERMDTSSDNVHGKYDQQKGSARKLTDGIHRLEEAIRETHLHNDVDDTFGNKVAQAKLLLRLQTAYEKGDIGANLLVGRYTAIMKDELQKIVELADMVHEEEEDEHVDWSGSEEDGMEELAALFA